MTVTEDIAQQRVSAQKRASAPTRPGQQAHTDSVAAFIPDQSRAERKTSFDVADFPIPGGREEDWRFTPVDRLAGLFQVEPTDDSKLILDISAPAGVQVSEATVGDSVFGSVLRPADRSSAAAWAGAQKATVVTIGSEVELADALAKRGMPFREAHELVGRRIAEAEALGTTLAALGPSKEITAQDLQALDVRRALAKRDITGGTAPRQVARAAKAAVRRLAGGAA